MISISFTGCFFAEPSLLKQSESCYTPTSRFIVRSKPLPAGAIIPVVYERPANCSEIGKFRMYSAPSFYFANQALQHNARRAGADCIVIEKLSINPTREFVPKHTVDITETRKLPTAEDWTNYHKKAKAWDGRNSSFPEWPTAGPVKVGTKEVPDYTKTLFENTTVEALFLRQK